ncbi:MucB/RseB C-terminal domain-containing protein [Motiliproteus sp.]|uniref:MucB/RseB C-terminal domain-containing protein n=1 Tax=Motiliproteus sp. TaxID=1898955 RepID=UPI003BAA6DB9
MSDRINESLSALMDDEVSEFELRRTLEQLDSEATSTWSRYHVGRAALKAETPVDPKLDISAGVMAALESEPVYSEVPQAPKRSSRFNWRPFGSVAIAASVTMMVIFGAQTFQGNTVPTENPSNIVLTGPKPVNPEFLPVQYGQPSVVMPSAQEPDVIRLTSPMEHYVDRHRALVKRQSPQWQVGWVPDGFRIVEHDHIYDAEVLLYSNGRTEVSVSVQPFASKKANPGAIQSGETVAVGKQVGDQFVTVVGDVPLMIADRIASSVKTKLQ